MGERPRFYLTTPIYYVNDRPHIGHLYTTTLADAIARLHRLRGEEVFLLTGTDEHAAKVVDAAAERGLSPQEWADRNAAAFRAAFAEFGIENDDFVRTSEERHKGFVRRAIASLVESGDVYLGDYEGWYDAGQEEYVPESRAKEHDYRSPITGRPLTKRCEKNYFFRLSGWSEALLQLLEESPRFVQPETRRNEVIGRIREGLADVPISRTGGGDWGVRFPGDEDHLIYVWIDALLSYASPLEAPDRQRFWPADLHLIGKEILWFHAVIWPALLMALQRTPGHEWLELPRAVYAHSFWVREGQKMSKSLGNFVELEQLRELVGRFGLEALRWYFATQGPLGAADADFAERRFAEVYNADLANTVGNAFSRISHMAERYLGGRFERPCEGGALRREAEALRSGGSADPLGLACAERGLALVRAIDGHIEATKPFRLAKQAGQEARVAEILYECAEAYRLASLELWPVLPAKMEEVWRRLGLAGYGAALGGRGAGRLAEWQRWGGLPAGSRLEPGPALFPRYEAPGMGRG